MTKKVNPENYKLAIGPLKVGQRVIALTTSGIVKYKGIVIRHNMGEGNAVIKRDDGRVNWGDNGGWDIRHKWREYGEPFDRLKFKWNINDGISSNNLYFDEVKNWKEYFGG